MVNDLARVSQEGKGMSMEGKEVAPEEDPKFQEFYHEMSPEIEKHEPSINELVEKFKAWKFYSAIYKDQVLVKIKILKSMVSKGTSGTALIS